MTGPSDRIAAHVAALDWASLPASAADAAKLVLLDAAGVMLGASGLAEEVRPFVRMAAAMGAGPCTIAGTNQRASLPLAALANGALAHALDYEDAFDKAPGHPNASLVPALIALAQGADGGLEAAHYFFSRFTLNPSRTTWPQQGQIGLPARLRWAA